MDRVLTIEMGRVTEAAAIYSARWMGRGDEKAADAAAVEAMRSAFNHCRIAGTVVIGEGERDEAPMLFIGEEVGTWESDDPKVDIALDPLEGTTICATGQPNALSVMAIAENGCFLHAPDTYMDKLAVGPNLKGVVDIRNTPTDNLNKIAQHKKCPLNQVTAIILERPRHKELISEVRATGARIKLIGDGDVSAAIATARENSGIDILLGIGGAPEGVIAAAALQCLEGDFQGILKFRNEHEKERALKMGVEDLQKVYGIGELAKGEDMIFSCTGVTDGELVKGVRFYKNRAITHSLVMRKKTGTIRLMETHHCLDKKSLA